MKTHPYIELEDSALWKTISKSVSELEKNGDLQLTTNLNYVVGFLCKQLINEKLISPASSPVKKEDEWYRIVKVVGRPHSK